MMTPDQERLYMLGQARSLVAFAGEMLRQANRALLPGGSADVTLECHQLLVQSIKITDRTYQKMAELLP